MILGIDPTVVENWGLWEALREIVQGAIDESPYNYVVEYDKNSEKIIIKNNGKLTRASLLIGHSTKRDDNKKIGEHGEGYKYAAAILLRLNKKFTVYNNDEVWRFTYKHSRTFKSTVIDVGISKWRIKKTHNITWEISNISKEECEEFQSKFIKKGDIRGTNGYILLDRPGYIFSGGLFVCYKKDLEFGYNFDVGVLSLQRDRNLIGDFDIFYRTSKCWTDLPDSPTHIKNGVLDVQYLHYHINGEKKEKVADKVYEMFVEEHGQSANPCYQESDKIKGANNIIVDENQRNIIRSSSFYTEPVKIVKTLTPFQILEDWYIGKEYNEVFENIIEMSRNWRIK